MVSYIYTTITGLHQEQEPQPDVWRRVQDGGKSVGLPGRGQQEYVQEEDRACQERISATAGSLPCQSCF